MPAVRSTVAAGARKTRVEGNLIYEHYPKTCAVTGLSENLKFAMRYEPIKLGVVRAAFERIEPETVTVWLCSDGLWNLRTAHLVFI